MWFKDKLNEEVNDAIKKMEELERENERLKSKVENLEKVIADVNSALTKAKPVIDFDIMRVFSIERLANDNKPCTLIGYFTGEPVAFTDGNVANKDVVHQWYLYCNEERHQELVDQFIAWKASK